MQKRRRERSVMLQHWKEQAQRLGKPEWGPMLAFTAGLHEACTRPASFPFRYPWEEIGTGYCYGPAFGHFDLVHAVLDAVRYRPIHARQQMLNYLHLQAADGLIPGCIWLRDGQIRWMTTKGHPPVWPVAVQELLEAHEDEELLRIGYAALVRQIGWFESKRKAEPEGYYYLDILEHVWESGMDDGIRYEGVERGPYACVDATSHVYLMYDYASRWAEHLGAAEEAAAFRSRADRLAAWIRDHLYCDETGLFHDRWSIRRPEQRRLTMESMWPVVVGAASPEQAARFIDGSLLNPDRFFTKHPMPTIAICDPGFELRMWRGPSWNSMTYWAARGCMRYGRLEAAGAMLERALDSTAAVYANTGTLWEFYHPFGGDPTELQRKPYTAFNQPCRDYMGHNPLIAMAALWAEAAAQT